jgi:hypothetical protein
LLRSQFQERYQKEWTQKWLETLSERAIAGPINPWQLATLAKFCRIRDLMVAHPLFVCQTWLTQWTGPLGFEFTGFWDCKTLAFVLRLSPKEFLLRWKSVEDRATVVVGAFVREHLRV